MKRVLFVDDEPMLLQGLQRMLRPLRCEWDMRFVAGGFQAIEELAREAADVVVTDLRMPEMTGAELLSQVRQLYPGTVRIVLSGQASRESVLQSVRVAHRQLSKPCDAETLKFNINQASQLRGLLKSTPLMRLVTRLESVPSLPATYVQIEDELAMPEPSVKRISEIIARDMGMTAKVLQMINSGLFGLRNRVDSVAQAVALLGLETIQSLVLTIHVFSKFNPNLLHALGIEGIWSHSQAVSELARRITVLQVSREGELADRKLPEQAGIAGLLHDVGKLIIAKALPFDFKKLQMMRETTRVPLWQAERAQLGTTHEEVGAYLLGLWGLPDVIVEAVAWHHRPAETQYCTLSPLAAVHVANALLHQKQTACSSSGVVDDLDTTFLERAGLIGYLSAWEALRDEVVRELAGSRY